MSASARNAERREPSSSEGARPAGSFFGRRKGHKLRAHQADLIEHLLPHLALDIAGPPPADPASLFDPPVAALRLEIGFCGGENLAGEASEFSVRGFILCPRS